MLTGIEVVDVDTATGWYDTDYEGKRDVALDALADGADLFIIHVEATDEAGHAGNVDEKVRALENWDRRILPGWSRGSTGWARGGCCCCPTTPRPCDCGPTPPTRCPTCWSTRRSTVPGGTYTEAGVADRARRARPRADGPPRRATDA